MNFDNLFVVSPIFGIIPSYKLGPFGGLGVRTFFCCRRFQTFNGKRLNVYTITHI